MISAGVIFSICSRVRLDLPRDSPSAGAAAGGGLELGVSLEQALDQRGHVGRFAGVVERDLGPIDQARYQREAGRFLVLGAPFGRLPAHVGEGSVELGLAVPR